MGGSARCEHGELRFQCYSCEPQRAFDHAVQCSFNRITVDGDTSTNDACVLAATGQAGIKLDNKHDAWHEFKSMLRLLFVDLATAIIRDAEGASKFITIDVKGGRSSAECLPRFWRRHSRVRCASLCVFYEQAVRHECEGESVPSVTNLCIAGEALGTGRHFF